MIRLLPALLLVAALLFGCTRDLVPGARLDACPAAAQTLLDPDC